ncbi:RHS domain-containing protein, partial [Acinetobacter baumannii]
NSFVPLLQGGYKDFIQLIETPDYQEYQTKPYSIYKDPVWNSTTRKKRADLEQITFYHCDQVGTPQTMTNTRGECVWEILQDTWGTALEIKVVNQDNPFEQNNLRFQGQYYDSETELHYNRYRYYEPHSARYVSKDPIGLEGGMNTSSYVSDPNQWIDPEGLNSFNYGEMFGIPASAQAGIAYQGQRNYDCWLKTGKQCELAIEPLFDYVICSGGFSAFGGSKIYNLHNGNVYTAGGVSLTGVKDMKDHAQTVGDIAKKSIDKSFKVGPANLSKLKKMFSGSCMAGYILNKPSGLTNSKATDEFLTGMGISQSIGWWGARIGVTTPAGSFFDRNGPVGIEAGIGTPGVDISVSDSKPTLVRTQD